MKTEKIYVNPDEPERMFRDKSLVGKIVSILYKPSYSQDYLVVGTTNEMSDQGLRIAGIIRWNPLIAGQIEAFTAEYTPNKPLHICFLESISIGHPNYSKFKEQLDNIEL